ncbi:MAG: hypothetical protein CME31_07680 [Gimesia sp.]|uniref:Uncharacterized protein n=1 Tax=Gimesia maris TaxID=122 RepID=A0A3D3RFJ8_9PLAN|nr:hypothetical protein [Gimesia sp.]HCO27585.1 hypothetical protein [Gimesia maris]
MKNYPKESRSSVMKYGAFTLKTSRNSLVPLNNVVTGCKILKRNMHHDLLRSQECGNQREALFDVKLQFSRIIFSALELPE